MGFTGAIYLLIILPNLQGVNWSQLPWDLQEQFIHSVIFIITQSSGGQLVTAPLGFTGAIYSLSHFSFFYQTQGFLHQNLICMAFTTLTTGNF